MARLPGGRPNAPYQCTDQMQCWPLAGAWSGLLRPLSGPSGAGHVVRRIHRHFPFLRRGNRPSSCDGRKAERGRCWSPGFGRRGPRPAPVRLTSTRAPMALDRLCRAVPAKLLSRSPAHQSSCCFESRSLALEAAHCRTDRTEDPGRAPQNVVV